MDKQAYKKIREKRIKEQKELEEKIGLSIKEIRIEKNMTQKELGEKIGLSQQAIALTEQGKRKIDISTLQKIARVLKVSIISFVDYERYLYMLQAKKQDAFCNYLSSINYECEESDSNHISITHDDKTYKISYDDYYAIEEMIKNFVEFTLENKLKASEILEQ